MATETVAEETITERNYRKLGMPPLKVNTTDERIREHVAINIRRGLPQVQPHRVTDQRMCIVGGGWSLNETFGELRQLYWEGAKIVTVNGSARWCIERNLRPSAHVVMDARPINKRFVELPDVPGLKFFLASQCHPSLFDALEGKEVYIWHACGAGENDLLDDYYVKNWAPTPGTSCVGFRAICVMRTLGFHWFDVFGIDSCYAPDGRHHGYEQPENDGEKTTTVACAGRQFRVSGWQVSQACHFRDLVKDHGDKFHINFHGDGLIAHAVKTAAAIGDE